LLAAACGNSGAPDFCANHAFYHAEHVDSVVTFALDVATPGRLDAELGVPVTLLNDGENKSGLRAVLQQAENVFTIRGGFGCEQATVEFSEEDGTVNVRYGVNCQQDSAFRQVDITLFHKMDSLQEVAATVAGPAASKRFLVNRQCSNAIFRLSETRHAAEESRP
jgi:hypothetical protein